MNNFLFGITYGYDGLRIKPALPREYGNCSVDFTYLGKAFHIDFVPSEEKSITFGDKKVMTGEIFIPDFEMLSENRILVKY